MIQSIGSKLCYKHKRIWVKGKGGGGWKIGEFTCQTQILKPRPYCQGADPSALKIQQF